jgi:hypothetical protein
MPRDGALTLSDVREPTLTIACERCGRYGRYIVKRAHRRAWRRRQPAGPSGDPRQLRQGPLAQRPPPMQGEVRGLQLPSLTIPQPWAAYPARTGGSSMEQSHDPAFLRRACRLFGNLSLRDPHAGRHSRHFWAHCAKGRSFPRRLRRPQAGQTRAHGPPEALYAHANFAAPSAASTDNGRLSRVASPFARER